MTDLSQPRKRLLQHIIEPSARPIWKRLGGYIHPDRRYLILAFICAAGVSSMSLLVGKLLQPFLDTASGAMSTHHLSHDDFKNLDKVSLSLIGIYTIRWFFTYGVTVYFAEAGQRLALRLRTDIYQHLQGLSLSFFNRQRTGALMSAINNDVPLLQGSISGLKDLAPAPILVIGGLITIFYISVPLTLAALLAFPVMAMTINGLTRRIRQITSDTQDKLADVNTLMEETLSGIRIIHSFGAEKHEIERFNRETKTAKDLAMWSTRQSAKIKPSIDLIGAIGVAFALWVAGRLVVSHELTLGHLGTFIFMLNQISVGIGGLGGVKVTYEQVQAAGGRILNNILNVQSDVQDAPNAVVFSSVEGCIEFRHVSFSYNPEMPVLRDISFTMNPGEVIAVVGHSGAGKSTIADLIPRFYDPQEGQILVDGYDIRTVTIESLRRQIGIVPQETMLFGGTIRDNIAYGNPVATDAMVQAAARQANAHDFISDPSILPDGYMTIVGERGKQLSGGQRQRIAIARALLKNPRILILDEATSSLDAKSEILVQEALAELMQGRTTLIIAHRLSTIVGADKILVLQAGRIVEAGTHTELVRMGGVYAQLHSNFAEGPESLAAG